MDAKPGKCVVCGKLLDPTRRLVRRTMRTITGKCRSCNARETGRRAAKRFLRCAWNKSAAQRKAAALIRRMGW